MIRPAHPDWNADGTFTRTYAGPCAGAYAGGTYTRTYAGPAPEPTPTEPRGPQFGVQVCGAYADGTYTRTYAGPCAGAFADGTYTKTHAGPHAGAYADGTYTMMGYMIFDQAGPAGLER